MGTVIDLRIGPISIDWAKNNMGADHGALFQDQDRTHVRSDQTNYEYCAEHDLDPEPAERAFARPLKSVIPRLELMGHTLAAAQAEYEVRLAEWIELNEDEADPPQGLLFSEFVAFLARNPIGALDDTFVEGFEPDDMARIRGRFAADPATDRIPVIEQDDGYSEASHFGGLISFLSTYSLLRLLALVPENLTVDVVWHYGPIVDSGWVNEEAFFPCARRNQTILIVTEGSSDVHILKHAIALLMPEVQDFFRFIDVSERHPFSGTGSLVKFAEGLVKIDVQNQILFLFDNDAEGWTALEAVQGYKLPPNMRTMVLPELDDFRQFEAYGPQGVQPGDINRRAAAIECYLDLNLPGRPPARVLWTNYKKERNDYQGSLEYKESYTKAFLEQTAETLSTGGYDISKLRIVMDHIFAECRTIAAGNNEALHQRANTSQ